MFLIASPPEPDNRSLSSFLRRRIHLQAPKSAQLAAAGERLDTLGGQASRGGFLALLGHLGAQRGHLDSDRGAR
jgi:hypothetical protein